MYDFNVGPNVGRFFRPVGTVRALEPRKLSALVLEMFAQVAFAIEDARTVGTGKLDVVLERQCLGDPLICVQLAHEIICKTNQSEATNH